MTTAAFDPLRMLTVLADHGVRHVMIGGLGGRAHGSNLITNDLDICYDRSRDNVERLVVALKELGATLRGVDEDVPFLLDPQTILAGDSFTFDTVAGALDILGTPAGTTGYRDLLKRSIEVGMGVFTVRVASLEDLMAMKEAAGRPKDMEALEVLGALREEIEARGG